MTSLPLGVAVTDSDRTRPLADGLVSIAGCSATILRMDVEELMFRASRCTEFDVCELAFGAYLAMLDRGDRRYTAIPAFPARAFRHNCLYIRRDRGIAAPADLRGRRMGVPDWTLTTAIWVRGLLADEYGVDIAEIEWLSGGLEQPGRAVRVPDAVPRGVSLMPLPVGKTLSGMLEAGELDAVIASRPPSCFARGAPGVERLFIDAAEERIWWKRHRIFPIQHLIVVRRRLADAKPWLCPALMAAFEAAKAAAIRTLHQCDPRPYALPWLNAAVEDCRRSFGSDPWPYRVAANRDAIEMLCRYAEAQGVTRRRVDVTELFHPTVAGSGTSD